MSSILALYPESILSLAPVRRLALAPVSSPLPRNACAFASHVGLAAGNGRAREGFQSLGGEIKEEVGLHVAAVGRNRSTGSDTQCGSSRARLCIKEGGRKKNTTALVSSRRWTLCSHFVQAHLLCTSAISFMLSFTDLVLLPLLADTFSNTGLTGTGNKQWVTRERLLCQRPGPYRCLWNPFTH